MTMAFQINLTITQADWLSHPIDLWNAGLLEAASAWSTENAKYPPSRGWSRNYSLADKSNGVITDPGRELTLYSTFYWKYLMFGTGLFGPYNTRIVAKNVFVFPGMPSVTSATGKHQSKATARATAGLVFAKSTKGSIWEGRYDAIKTSLKEAFKKGITEYRG